MVKSKEKILEKSSELFLSIGVKAITMDDVASSLCMSKKTLYNHFQTKKVLIKETLTYFFSCIDQIIEEIDSCNLNAIEKWLIVSEKISLVDEGNCSLQIKKYYPDIFEEVQKQQWKMIQRNFRKNLSQGMLEGLFRENFDMDLFIRIYYSSALSIEVHSVFEDINLSYKELKNKFIEFQIRSIATKEGVKELERIL
ncbi:MAG: TetR/AcrR family transcriptional regulator [Flavobacteriales bacterium]